MNPKTYLLDTSFLIALDAEVEARDVGPAMRTLASMRGAKVFITPVTVAEILEGAEDFVGAARSLADYHQTVIGWQAAKRCALNQSRAASRMGENDAWQAALAVMGGHTLVARDRGFERKPWLDYRDFSRA